MNQSETVFLFDVDNTLLDNDRVTRDLRRFLDKEVGAERSGVYWGIFEELRTELGYADYLGALQRYRLAHPYDSHLLAVSTYLINYPFANRLFPNSLDVIEKCSQIGQVVILTDGDELSIFLLQLDAGGDVGLDLALRALHRDGIAAQFHLDPGGDGDRLFSNSRHGVTYSL